MTDITVTLTQDEVQYLLNAMDTHVKTHGLRVATASVVILAKLRTELQASGGDQGVDGANQSEPSGDQEQAVH